MASDIRKYTPGDFYGHSPAIKMVELITRIGYNQELQLDIGHITNISPMEITLVDGLLLEEDDFTLPERLTKHYEWHNGIKVAVDPRIMVDDAVIGIMDEHKGNYMIVDRIKKSEADEWIEPPQVD